MALLNENASTKNTKATKKGELPLRDLRVLRGGLSGRGGSRTHKQSPPSQDGRFAEFAYSTGFSAGTGGIRTRTIQGLSLAALPVGVPCRHEASSMGFEPTTFSVTGRRALQAAPRGQILERAAHGVSGLPSYFRFHRLLRTRLFPTPGAGIEPASPGSKPGALPLRHPGRVVRVGIEPTQAEADGFTARPLFQSGT